MSIIRKCDCLKKLTDVLREETGDNTAFVESSVMINSATGEQVLKFKPVYAYYRKKKKDGTFTKKQLKTFYTINYCPICGRKY